MSSQRQVLPLLSHEDALLRTLYRQFNISIDKLPQRPEDLRKFIETWNNLTGRGDAAPEVLHYMMTRRKKKNWEHLGRSAEKVPPQDVTLNEQEKEHLDAIHEQLQVSSDTYAVNPEAAQRLQAEFARRAGRIIPQEILAAVMMNRRKAGALATLKPKGDNIGFNDLDQVAQ